LPYRVFRNEKGKYFLKEFRSSIYPTIFRLNEKGISNFVWFGWPGIFPKNKKEKDAIRILLAPLKCFPIFLN
jgi:hypothetical protein